MNKKYEELEKMAQDIIDWLYKNGNPYQAIIIKIDGIEVVQTEALIPVEVRD